MFPDVHQTVEQLVRFDRTYEPDPTSHARYTELRVAYEEVLRTVRPTYGRPNKNGRGRRPFPNPARQPCVGGRPCDDCAEDD